MRKVIYKIGKNDFQAKSLYEIRNHVESVNRIYKCNNYDGAIVNRYVCCRDVWFIDFEFAPRQINVVNGRAILRRINVPVCSFIPRESNAKP